MIRRQRCCRYTQKRAPLPVRPPTWNRAYTCNRGLGEIAQVSRFCHPGKRHTRRSVYLILKTNVFIPEPEIIQPRTVIRADDQNTQEATKATSHDILRGVRFDERHQTGLIPALFNAVHKRLVYLGPDKIRRNSTLTSLIFPVSLQSANTCKSFLLVLFVTSKLPMTRITHQLSTVCVEVKPTSTKHYIHLYLIRSTIHRNWR